MNQVRELEDEVAAVDREIASVGEEREQNLKKLNLKRVQHVTTLQQLGLLDETLSSMDDPALFDYSQECLRAESPSPSSARWRSEVDLKVQGIRSPDHSRKVSPPVAIILGSSRAKSESDPAIASTECHGDMDVVSSAPCGITTHKISQENLKPGQGKKNVKSPDASPRTSKH